jgi:hypothetical protein
MRLMLATAAAVLAFSSPAFASSVTNVTVDNSFPTNAAGARTAYDVKFKTSASGALNQGDAIDLTLPAGSKFDNVGAPFGFACFGVGATLECRAPSAIAAGADVDIQLRVVTNAPTPGTGNVVTVSTASDADPVDSPPFEIVPAHPVDSANVDIFVTTPAVPEYRIAVVPSPTGRLAGEISSRIHLTFPPEIDVSQAKGRMASASGRTFGECGANGTPHGVDCVVSGPDATNATGDRVDIKLTRIPNAPAPGPYRVTVSTSSDPIEASTADFLPGLPARPDTFIDDPATKLNGATATFAFSQVIPSPFDREIVAGGFECRVDGAAFARCETPFTTPALGNGPHRFEVRGLTMYGFEDLTPAARDFTIAAAVYKQQVVTAPASGKVKVCTAPGKGCHALTAPVLTPVGRTIDARKGTLALTLGGANGAQQTVRVSGGVFKVTQTASGTDLTLNQSLGTCARHRTRTLRVRGAGDVRVRGRYGTAARGTDWTVKDSCHSTVVRAVHGTVSVRDTGKRKTLTLRAGERYVATRR